MQVSVTFNFDEIRKESYLSDKYKNTWVDPNNPTDAEITKSIKEAEKLMNGHGRILVRASGTESKIRVMGECENRKLLEKCLNIILAKIK